MLAYIKSNPKLAAQAGSAAASIARSNPELAVQVASGAAASAGGTGLGGPAAGSSNSWGGGP